MPCSDICNFLENNRFLIYFVSWGLSKPLSLLLADLCMVNIVQNETSFLAEPFGSWNKKCKTILWSGLKITKCTRDEILSLSKHKCTSSLKTQFVYKFGKKVQTRRTKFHINMNEVVVKSHCSQPKVQSSQKTIYSKMNMYIFTRSATQRWS